MKDLIDKLPLALKHLKQHEADWQWLESNKYIKKRYSEQWVAIKNKKLVDHDNDLRILVKRLRSNHFKTGLMVIEYMYKKEPMWIL